MTDVELKIHMFGHGITLVLVILKLVGVIAWSWWIVCIISIILIGVTIIHVGGDCLD